MKRQMGWLCSVVFLAAMAARGDLIFSEYVEGSGNNKALEIYNTGPGSAPLSNAVVEIYYNGNTASTFSVTLSNATLTAGSVYVIAHSAASNGVLAVADRLSGSLSFNGDDAIVLKQAGVVVDSIGQVGFDPGLAWTSNNVSTVDQTLRRRVEITTGDSVPTDAFDPSLEWTVHGLDAFGDLGAHGEGLAIIDLDGDGMPDDWELEAFGAMGAQPGDDADGDGLSNQEEYQAGTGPMDPSSTFAMELATWDGDGLHLGWRGGTNCLQRLEQAATVGDFYSNNWIVVAVWTSTLVSAAIDLPDPTAAAGFYRIKASRLQ